MVDHFPQSHLADWRSVYLGFVDLEPRLASVDLVLEFELPDFLNLRLCTVDP